MAIALESRIPTGCFPPIRRRATLARAPVRDGEGPADRQPARPHRSAMVRRRRAVRQRIGAVHHARPLRVPDALQPGRARSRTSAFRAATAATVEHDARKIWHAFAAHYHLFRGTPTRLWLDHAFNTVFGIDERLTRRIRRPLFRPHQRDASPTPAFRPRALFERFNIEVIATTESPLDPLAHHARSAHRDGRAAWSPLIARIRSSTPSSTAFAANVAQFGALTGENTATWSGYLAAHRNRRAFFKSMGATSTDHGHPTARTCDLAARRMPAAARSRARRDDHARTTPRRSAARC